MPHFFIIQCRLTGDRCAEHGDAMFFAHRLCFLHNATFFQHRSQNATDADFFHHPRTSRLTSRRRSQTSPRACAPLRAYVCTCVHMRSLIATPTADYTVPTYVRTYTCAYVRARMDEIFLILSEKNFCFSMLMRSQHLEITYFHGIKIFFKKVLTNVLPCLIIGTVKGSLTPESKGDSTMNTTFTFADKSSFDRFVKWVDSCTEHAYSWHKDILGYHIEVCNLDLGDVPADLLDINAIDLH